jgi:predicted Zn-dependent protease
MKKFGVPSRVARLLTLAVALGASAGVNVAALGQTAKVPVNAPTAPLPNLGDGSEMAPGAERRIGDRIAAELYRDIDYVDDPVIMEYVQGIWQPLLAGARLRGELPPELDSAYAWEILLGRDRSVNAFALPGAYLGLHLGLVAVVANRDELASVLAHELSHVTQRHISRLMARQSQQAPLLMGAMILGILAASKNPGSANAVIVGGQAMAAQSQLNFSRDMEREADRIGFGVMTQAGFEPQGFVGMFEKLQAATRLNDSGSYPYLRSHPLTTERMADMQARISGVHMPPAVPDLDSAQEHAMISARARVLANPDVDALHNWSREIQPASLERKSPSEQVGVLYGATLAAIKLHDYPQAQILWNRLAASVRKPAAQAAALLRLLGAEMALAQGDGRKAETMLFGLDPAGRSVLFLGLQAATLTGHLVQPIQSMQAWVAEHPRDAQGWQLLSSAYAAQGRKVAAVRAEAESSIAQFDYAGAMIRFKAVQEMARQSTQPSDHVEAAIADSRIRQLESALKEQAAER